MSIHFANIFSSQTRSQVLLGLANFKNPVCVNELAEISDCSLCSVHAAVKDLYKTNVLQSSRQQNETKYQLNRLSPNFELIIAIKTVNEQQTLQQRANLYSKKAQRVLKFVSDSYQLMSNVKKCRDN